VDRVSIKRMCAGKEFQVQGTDTEKAREKKIAMLVVTEICVGRAQRRNVIQLALMTFI